VRLWHVALKYFPCSILCGLGFWVGIFLAPPALPALEITPFHTQNQSPLVQIYGLPALGDGKVLPFHKAEGKFLVDLANHYIDDSNPQESILLDGESTRLTLEGRFGFWRDLECGLEIPFVVQSGGFLDGFIQTYHSTFGFPQGGRDLAPNNRLLYQYQSHGRELLKIDSSSAGLGDLRLTGAWQAYRKETPPNRAVSLRASLKLPTGDAEQLHGSGSTDLAIWVSARQDHKVSIGPISLFGGAGIMGLTEGNVLPEQQRHWIGFGGIGAGWNPIHWLALKIQIDTHTPFYQDSELRELNAIAAQLLLGGTLAFSEWTSLDLGVGEDIIVKTFPDVTFHLALRHRF